MTKNIKSIHRPARAVANAGMPTPYEQGRLAGIAGEPYDNFYDQPGEEYEHNDFENGYREGVRVSLMSRG